jgi:hypothetical protein
VSLNSLPANFEGDGFAGEDLDKDLHTTGDKEDEGESGFLLDIVVGEGAAVLELLSGKDETLLIGGDALLVLNLGFQDVVDGVGGFNVVRKGIQLRF